LRQLLAGGDSLSVSHVQRVLNGLPQLRLINGYGPTENTTFSVCHAITAETLLPTSVPIGRPISNTRAYILDDQMQPVPVGLPGELYLAGDGLAIEYLNTPELTQARFLTVDLPEVGTERVYRTGDMVRYQPSGLIEFMGRIDTQVKVRGYRIELAEIEAVLEQSPLVTSAVVTTVEDRSLPGDKKLIAYVVPASASSLEDASFVEAVREDISKGLPDYMQPSAVVVLAELPRTANGKVDRRSLPAPKAQAPSTTPKRTVFSDTEAKLLLLASQLLGTTSLGVEDNLFEQGFDSLMVFRLCTLASEQGLRVTARQVFEHKSILLISTAIDTVAEQNTTVPQKSGPISGPIHVQPRDRFRRKITT
jgi:acyl-coenzyme A synthetase/AMP-(fatty) acid ligase/aryl carrier-like protein